MSKPARNSLLQAIEANYRAGQLTIWLLLALYAGPKDATVTRRFIEDATDFTLEYNQTSVYRALRRLHDRGLLEVRNIKQLNLPDAKLYSLSPYGKEILLLFLERNQLSIIPNQAVQKLIYKCLGRKTGLEPATFGTTTRRSTC